MPSALFERTVAFYKDVVGLSPLQIGRGSQGFEFGGMTLWIDAVNHATHTEVWLELATEDVDAGSASIVAAGGRVADEIEPLEGRRAHWVIDPAGLVVLLTTPEGTTTKAP
ncbi:MAG TPA: VOC family protein [Acidimicrobiales bacterium]|nr:VOC family protein [Acidimicrobiales bacterium]